ALSDRDGTHGASVAPRGYNVDRGAIGSWAGRAAGRWSAEAGNCREGARVENVQRVEAQEITGSPARRQAAPPQPRLRAPEPCEHETNTLATAIHDPRAGTRCTSSTTTSELGGSASTSCCSRAATPVAANGHAGARVPSASIKAARPARPLA